MHSRILAFSYSLVVISAWTVCPAFAQETSFTQESFHGRQAYVLENSRMRVSALRGAGHIAEIRLKSDDPKKSVNPMRVPHFPTIEPWEYDPAKHDRVYGGGTNRWLMSGYMGHLLNFPTFGGPSENEAKSGLGNHGEALTVEWRKDGAEADDHGVRLWYSAHLPKTEYNVGRILTLPADEAVLYIEEWVENLLPFDRPAHWVQHATFGPPFVEAGKNVLDMSATKGQVRGDTSGSNSLTGGDVEWPDGKSYDGKPVSLREMQTRQGAGTYAGYLMDPSRERNYFTMFHKDFSVLIGYIWKTKDFPWIGDWQENHRNKQLPWNGKVVARGMEFGTTPFGGPMQNVVSNGTLFGVPTYVWIAARERKTVNYVAFVTEIGAGYKGVADVRVDGGKIVVTERETGKTISLKSEREW